MNVLILGLNYAPEPVGIGPYTTGMALALAAFGHRVTVVCGKPYYPAWNVNPAFSGGGVRQSVEDRVRVIRVPLYVARAGRAASEMCNGTRAGIEIASAYFPMREVRETRKGPLTCDLRVVFFEEEFFSFQKVSTKMQIECCVPIFSVVR